MLRSWRSGLSKEKARGPLWKTCTAVENWLFNACAVDHADLNHSVKNKKAPEIADPERKCERFSAVSYSIRVPRSLAWNESSKTFGLSHMILLRGVSCPGAARFRPVPNRTLPNHQSAVAY